MHPVSVVEPFPRKLRVPKFMCMEDICNLLGITSRNTCHSKLFRRSMFVPAATLQGMMNPGTDAVYASISV
jgi:hypothetical protein